MADLNSLAIFSKVVEAKGFSEAARRLKIPISTVSCRVADRYDPKFREMRAFQPYYRPSPPCRFQGCVIINRRALNEPSWNVVPAGEFDRIVEPVDRQPWKSLHLRRALELPRDCQAYRQWLDWVQNSVHYADLANSSRRGRRSGRREAHGGPFCITTRRTSPPWTCSLFRPSVSTCSMLSSSSGSVAEILSGSMSRHIRPPIGSRDKSRRHSPGTRLREALDIQAGFLAEKVKGHS